MRDYEITIKFLIKDATKCDAENYMNELIEYFNTDLQLGGDEVISARYREVVSD